MTVEEFANVTQRIIAKDGFDDYVPMACFPARRTLAALAGIPQEVDIEEAALEMANRKRQAGEVVLVEFKADSSHFKVIRLEGEARTERVFEAVGE